MEVLHSLMDKKYGEKAVSAAIEIFQEKTVSNNPYATITYLVDYRPTAYAQIGSMLESYVIVHGKRAESRAGEKAYRIGDDDVIIWCDVCAPEAVNIKLSTTALKNFLASIDTQT